MKRQLIIATFAFAGALHGADDDNAYFEAKVLPLLQKRCYECHSHEKKIKGGLALDSRSGWEHGGDNGRAIEPGDLEKSLLIKAVRYTDSDLQMPTKGKLPAEEIATLGKSPVRSGVTRAIHPLFAPRPPDPLTPRRPSPF